MNINVVCPHCLKVNRIPKKESYSKANCGECKNSLLDAKPLGVDANALGVFLANSELPVIIDFWAPWCGPCLQMAPSFEKVASSLALKAQLIKVNTEEHNALGAQYGIQSIPTLVLFKHGKEINRVSGALDANSLENWIRQNS